MLPSNEAMVTAPNLNVLFVVDTTISMWAEDYDGDHSRMDGVREACNTIMDEFSGSSFSIVTFSDVAEVTMPLTTDKQSITDALEYIYEPTIYTARGSNMNCPVGEMDRILEYMKSEYEDRETIVFFFSDGEETNDGSKDNSLVDSSDDEDADSEDSEDTKDSDGSGEAEDSSSSKYAPYASVSGKIDGGAVIGVGSFDGTTMVDGDGNEVNDPGTGKPAVTRLGRDSLEEIASELRLEYIHMEEVKDISYLTETIITDAQYEAQLREDTKNKKDTYFYWIPVLMMLLIGENLLFRR
jgi:Ca-activated chloride channel family protein